MRALINPDSIFDTQIDTKKIYVSVKYKFQPHNYVAKDGTSLLYLHVWEKYPPQKIPLELHIPAKYWDLVNKRVIKGCPGGVDINLSIDQVQAKITEITIRYRLSGTVLTLEKFLEEFHHGIPRIDFISFFHYAKEKDYKLGRIKYNTWKKENSVYRIFKEFRPKLLFCDFSNDVVDQFKLWRKQAGIKNTTINANLRVLKKYIGRAEDDGIPMKLVKKKIKVGSTNGSREALTRKELRKLMDYYKSAILRENHKVPLARFLFSCFTGMRIGDNQDVARDSIYNGLIYFEQQKNDRLNKIKLNKTAKKILKRCPEIYSESYTDQHINRKLQEAAKFLGIRTHITFHISRHTFATNLLDEGCDIRVVQQLLDHESIETTMIYSHVNQKKKNSQIKLLDKIK